MKLDMVQLDINVGARKDGFELLDIENLLFFNSSIQLR